MFAPRAALPVLAGRDGCGSRSLWQVAAMAEAGNYKSALNEMVMKVIGRPINQADILYTVSLASLVAGVPQYRAAVKIVALDGIEFEGEPLPRRKAAEHSAAKAALAVAAASSWASMPAAARAEASDLAAGRLSNHKGHLQELLAKLQGSAYMGSALAARYETVTVSSGRFVCTVHVSINGETTTFLGEVRTKTKDAEQSAAGVALQAYAMNPPVLVPLSSAQLFPASPGPGAIALQGVAAPCENCKSTLNELVMKAIARPTTPQDVLYSIRTSGDSNQFQATVCVVAMDPSIEFEGEARTRKKDAEQSAAQAALQHFLADMSASTAAPVTTPAAAATPAAAGRTAIPPSLRAPSQAPGTVPPLEGRVPPPRRIAAAPVVPSRGCADGRAGNYKSTLNELIMKLTCRPLVAGDVVYNVTPTVTGQFQAALQLVALKDSGGPIDFGGAPCTRKRDAEQSAAQAALVTLSGESGLEVICEDALDVPGQSKSNFKSVLNELVMKLTSSPLCSTDVVYTIHSSSTGHFEATLVVMAIDNSISFTGVPCARKKDAEQSAASAALEHFSRPDLQRRTADKPCVAAAAGAVQAPPMQSGGPLGQIGSSQQKDASMPTWVFCDVGAAGRKPQP